MLNIHTQIISPEAVTSWQQMPVLNFKLPVSFNFLETEGQIHMSCLHVSCLLYQKHHQS